MKLTFKKAVPVLALSLAVQAAYAGNITDINVSVLPDQRRVIKVKFDKDITKPSGFIYTTPSRIALDFAGTKIQLPQKQLSYNDSLLNHIIAADDNERARISLSLSKEGQYDTEVKGDEVWVYVSESSGSSAPPVAAESKKGSKAGKGKKDSQAMAQADSGSNDMPAPNDSFSGHAPLNVNFVTAPNKTGVVQYSSAYDGQPQVKVLSDRIVVTLKNYPLSAADQKNLDVSSFSTPVRNVAVRRVGNDTQITVRNSGKWDHRVRTSNGRNEIRISPSLSSVLGESGFKPKSTQQSFSGKRISLDFQNIDVRTILQILSKESGLNIVASDAVQGKMTLSLKDVPWDQALALVLDTYDLDKAQQGNIIRIAPREELQKRIQEELKSLQEREKYEPLISRTFQLKYKNVEEFRDILKLGSGDGKGGNSMLSGRGNAMIDPATNTLIVTDVPKVVKKFEALIAELDVAARQVMVEARIVEAAEGVSRDLGIRFGYARRGATAIGNNLDAAINNRNAALGSANTTLLNPNVNLPASAAVNTISLVRSVASGALGLELSAMETDNRSKTISSPRVLTQDGKEAEIVQGLEIPYQTRTENGYQTAFKQAALTLKVTPRITPDSKVILDVLVSKNDVDRSLRNINGEPAIAKREVKTQAMIEDGGTLVVGGVYQEVFDNTVSKVPLLGDLPVVGNLFKSRGRNHSRNELLFFITPRIMGGESNVMRY
ncbi:type IV pilus secretin PilQ [Conchiformibius steedae]|uniref:type IV pilus secretin PilQ n=1 Tax=Conchiformibius steedae TaxID=153493 RepID=UPI0026ED7AF5|nr:type IV pilus secretin PilQ [Conchiformibius steedae]